MMDNVEKMRAGGTGAAGFGPIPTCAHAADQAAPAEEVVMKIIRLLNQICLTEQLTIVDRAFLQGASIMFSELSKASDELLTLPFAESPEFAPSTVEARVSSTRASSPRAATTTASEASRPRRRPESPATRREPRTEPGQAPQ